MSALWLRVNPAIMKVLYRQDEMHALINKTILSMPDFIADADFLDAEHFF